MSRTPHFLLLAEHPDFAPGHHDLTVGATTPIDVPALRLVAGVIVTGQVLRDNKPVAGATVVLQSLPTARAGKLDHVPVHVEAVTDAEGRYRLPRVAHGTYELHTHENVDPLPRARQMQHSRRKVVVRHQAYTDVQQENLALPK